MDALFKFATREEAIAVGEQLGITQEIYVTPPPLKVTREVLRTPAPYEEIQADGSAITITPATYTELVIEEIPQAPVMQHDTASYVGGNSIDVIGYWSPDENTAPAWWVLVRLTTALPEGIDLSSYLVWNSDSGLPCDETMPDRRFC